MSWFSGQATRPITFEMSAAHHERLGRMNGESADHDTDETFDSWCVDCGDEAIAGLCEPCRDVEYDRDRLDDR